MQTYLGIAERRKDFIRNKSALSPSVAFPLFFIFSISPMKTHFTDWTVWSMSLVPTHKRLRWRDHKFEANLVYTVNTPPSTPQHTYTQSRGWGTSPGSQPVLSPEITCGIKAEVGEYSVGKVLLHASSRR